MMPSVQQGPLRGGISMSEPITDLLAPFFQTPTPYQEQEQDKGIVIPGGGGRFAACTWVCASMLRRLGCRLPIQVWHMGGKEHDDQLFEMLAKLDVETVNVFDVMKEHHHEHMGGWELKPYAMLHSPFREVLLLDADNMPVVDPTYLFDTTEYANTGAIFWPDYWRTAPDRSFWEVMGIPYRDEPEFESGQVLIDKKRCWDALRLTNWLCERGVRLFWEHCYGDKDCFRAAWHRTNTPFSQPSQGVTTLSDYVMVQYDFEGRRLFQHRNIAKWEIGSNRRIHDFWHQEECLKAVAQLRRRKLRNCFGLNDDDLAQTDSLAGNEYWYVRCRHDCRRMVLGADLEIVDGQGGLEQCYFVKDGRLHIVDGENELTCQLTRLDDVWFGKWSRFERMPVLLEPV